MRSKCSKAERASLDIDSKDGYSQTPVLDSFKDSNEALVKLLLDIGQRHGHEILGNMSRAWPI